MLTRMTQHMLTQRSMASVDGGLLRMSRAQEQLSTGRRLNRPSDSPTDTVTAMRARAAIAEQEQYSRNAKDGLARLSTIDTAISSATAQVRRAYELAVRGANTAATSQTAADALAAEVTQIRASVLTEANAQYLGRPVFGGTTAGSTAFEDVNGTVTYTGFDSPVTRTVGDGVSVRVDSSGSSVFGTAGTDSVFDHLDALTQALHGLDSAGIEKAIGDLQSDLDRFSAAAADEGARYNQITTASDTADGTKLSLTSTLSDVEDVDFAAATIELATQQTAYQAALQSTAKTIQPSLLDFLR